MALNATPGDAAADAYVTLADADSYHADRNSSDWSALSTAEKEAAIRYATQYVDGRYRWRGTIADTTQALGWPRDDAEDDEGRTLTGIPGKLQAAVCELALMHSQEALNAAQGPRVVSEVVGPIETEYADAAGNQGQEYPLVESLLRGLTRGTTNAVKGRRA